MPFQRARYPANWSELAHAAKAAAGWRCDGCGAPQGALAVGRRNQLYRVVLAACHLDHDPANPAPRLAVWCQPCHLRYDAFQRWRSRRRGERLRAVAAGQIEWTSDDRDEEVARGLGDRRISGSLHSQDALRDPRPGGLRRPHDGQRRRGL